MHFALFPELSVQHFRIILHIVEADTHSFAAISRCVGGLTLDIMAATFVMVCLGVAFWRAFTLITSRLAGTLQEGLSISFLTLHMVPRETVCPIPINSF